VQSAAGVDWVAIAGIAGTLLAGVLGVAGAWFVQKRRLVYEDRTRFHERRLTANAAYLEACDEVTVAITTGAIGPAHVRRMINAYYVVMLLASYTVWKSARRYNAAIWKYMDAPETNRNSEREAYHTELARLLFAMRQDLEVEGVEGITKDELDKLLAAG
jgi:hypothetical protein